MKKIAAFMTCLFLLSAGAGFANAESITFTTEYEYPSSEVDTPLARRTIAVEKASRLLFERVTAYLETRPEIKQWRLTREQIDSLVFIAFRPEITELRKTVAAFRIRVKITADDRKLAECIEAARRDPQKMHGAVQLRKRSDDLLLQAEKRKKELEANPVRDDSQGTDPYGQSVRKLALMDDVTRGFSSALLGKHREAIVAYDRAIDLDQSNHDAYYYRGLSYLHLHDRNQATRDFENAMNGIEIDDQYIADYRNIPQAVKEKSAPDEIIKMMDKLIGANRDHADAFYNRGTAFLILGKLDHAINDFNRAIELKPQVLDYYYNQKLAMRCIETPDRWIELPPIEAELQGRKNIAGQLSKKKKPVKSKLPADKKRPGYFKSQADKKRKGLPEGALFLRH